jgi:hypothetical protein
MAPPPRHRQRAALLALSYVVFCTERAFADEPLPASVTYTASASCPAQAEFWRQVLVHLRGVPAKLRPIHVEIVQSEDRALARVTFEDDRGQRGKRELSGANCVEAVAAAALVVALEIDAQAQAAQTPQPPAKPADPPPRSKAPVQQSDPPAPVGEPPADRKPGSTAHNGALVWAVGAGAVAEHAIAPSPLLGVDAFVGVGQRAPHWDVRANFVYMRSGTVEHSGQSAEFVLLGGRLDGCAFPFLDLERSTLGPCLSVELASVRSSGQAREGFVGTDESTAWLAAGPLLRFRRVFAELRIELAGGPWFPIAGTRTFVFGRPGGEEDDFHEVPPVGWTAGASLSLALD